MRQFREEVGLSLRDMAGLLGVSRSVIGHYEKGVRQLPRGASLKLARMQLAWMNATSNKQDVLTVKLPQLATEERKIIKLLKTEIRRASANAVRFSQTLATMRGTQQVRLRKLQFIQTLMAETPASSRSMFFLKLLEKKSAYTMKNCCNARQQMVRYYLFVMNSCKQLAIECQEELMRGSGC